MYVSLIPSAGHSYKSAKAVQADWQADIDFIICCNFHPYDGKAINRAQAAETNDNYSVRFANLTKSCNVDRKAAFKELIKSKKTGSNAARIGMHALPPALQQNERLASACKKTPQLPPVLPAAAYEKLHRDRQSEEIEIENEAAIKTAEASQAPAADQEPKTRIELQSNPAACCSDSNSRYALQNVEIRQSSAEADKVFLGATDGRHAAIVKAPGTTAETSQAPGKIFPSKKNQWPKRPADQLVTINGNGNQWSRSAVQKPTAIELQEIDGRFPDIADVMPDISGLQEITLDVALLAKLAEALNTHNSMEATKLTLFVGKADQPAAIVGQNGIGVIMPYTKDKQAGRYNAQLAEYKRSCKS
tara:strand:- start:302 stop:1384 length:1083 start_codon:yes stop_codon:yes gene_type:complete